MLNPPERATKKDMSPVELLREAKQSVRAYSANRSLSADERDEAVSRVLEEVMRTTKGGPADGALVNHVARMQVANASSLRRGLKSGSSASALRTLNETVRSMEESGRVVTDRERDALAEKIRDGWHDQAHKPAEGFHHDRSTVSFDDIDEEDLPASLIDPYSPEAALLDGKYGDGVYHALEKLTSGDRSAKGELRRNAWKVVTEGTDIPPVRAKLPSAVSKTVSSSVRSAGGVMPVLDKYDQGIVDQSTESLFLPFRQSARGRGWDHEVQAPVASRARVSVTASEAQPIDR